MPADRHAPGGELRLLRLATHRASALSAPRDALLQGGGGARATAPPDTLPRTLRCGCGPQLLLLGRAAHRLFAHADVFQPGTTHPLGRYDCWLKPPHASPPGLKPRGVRRAKARVCQTLGTLLVALRHWTLMLTYVFSGIAGLMLGYMLLRTRLIPQWLSVLGLIGYAALLVGAVLNTLGLIDTAAGTGVVWLVPGGLFELVLPIWLFARGFHLTAASRK